MKIRCSVIYMWGTDPRLKNEEDTIMSTKAYYPISEIGAGKVGFSKTRSIIEAAFYGNNVVKVETLKEAYELAKIHREPL